MTRILNLYTSAGQMLSGALARVAVPTLARFVFAATLLVYYWHSATLKIGDGIFGLFAPSTGAYVQMFPKAMEAVTYDQSALAFHYHLIAFAGTWAEFLLPLLLVIGLFTRLAAIGMIGFIAVQSLTDLYGHGAAPGAWFDRLADGLLLDQRLFWVYPLVVLIFMGAGPLSLDRLWIEKPLQDN